MTKTTKQRKFVGIVKWVEDEGIHLQVWEFEGQTCINKESLTEYLKFSECTMDYSECDGHSFPQQGDLVVIHYTNSYKKKCHHVKVVRDPTTSEELEELDQAIKELDEHIKERDANKSEQ